MAVRDRPYVTASIKSLNGQWRAAYHGRSVNKAFYRAAGRRCRMPRVLLRCLKRRRPGEAWRRRSAPSCGERSTLCYRVVGRRPFTRLSDHVPLRRLLRVIDRASALIDLWFCNFTIFSVNRKRGKVTLCWATGWDIRGLRRRPGSESLRLFFLKL